MIIQKRIDSFLLCDRRRIGALDGVRSTAIILVIIRHSFDRPLREITLHPLLQYIMGFGWIGVDLFFVLSGFLIGGIIYDKLRRDSFFFSGFYLSRSLRILPAAYFVLLLTGWSAIGLNYQTLFNFALIVNYTGRSFNDIYWSLNVEEHFYIVFSLLFVFYFKFIAQKENNNLKQTIYVLLGIVLLEWIARFYFTCLHSGNVMMANSVGIASHWIIDYFLLGVLGAVLYKNNIIPEKRALGYLLLLVPIGYLLLAVSTATYCHNTMNNQTPPLYGVLGPFYSLWCFLFVICAATQQNIVTKFLSLSIWRYIAVLSYSMYLVHLSCLEYLDPFLLFIKGHLVEFPNMLAFTTILLLLTTSALVALCVFILVERPFLLMRSRLLKRFGLKKADNSVIALRVGSGSAQAGWHKSKSLNVPDNFFLELLPPDSPELDPVENSGNTQKNMPVVTDCSLKKTI